MSREIKIEVSPVISGPSNIGTEFHTDNVTVKRIPAVYSNPSKAGYFRPWRFTPAERSGTSKIFYAKTTRFRVIVDAAQFGSNIQINVVGKHIEVEASHDLVKDKLGQISRWMKRKYKVPPDVQMDTLTSQLRKKGSLVLNADRNLEDSLGKDFYKEFPQMTTKKPTPTPSE